MGDNHSKRATIKDVANLAGVSPSTVSFVLNNTKGQKISENTRKKILQCVELLGYRPHYSATHIRARKSQTIAILSSYRIQSLYFLDLIDGIFSAANSAGYGLLVCQSNRDSEPRQCIDYFNEGRIDGVVFISSAHSEEKSMESQYIDCFQRNHIPFTVVYGYTHIDGVCYSNTNFYADGKNACRLLIEHGARSIHYIGSLDKYGRQPYLPKTEQDRMNGYIDAMRESGLSPKISFLPRDFRSEEHASLIQQTINAPADAFITCWATFGLQVLSLLNQIGKRVPQDVRVIALDTLPYLEYTTPSLSAIRMPFREMAYYATTMLLKQLHGENIQSCSRAFDGEIEIRNSI